MKKLPLSVVILAKNEEKNIQRAIQSVKFADEVIILDDNSQDGTLQIAKENGAVVYTRELNEDFAEQRNYGISKSTHDWILFIDADEELTNELQDEIKAVVQGNPHFLVYSIKRRDFWWGRELKYGETQKVRNKGLIRLVKKGSGTWTGTVHESFRTNESVGMFEYFLNHYPHPTLKEFLQEINKYSSVRAKELFKAGKKTNSWEIICLPVGKFILSYIIYLGFLDGASGFAYSFMMSFHSFLVRAKLYQYWNYPTK